ncbi:MAG: AMP-binding protein, partial [Streptomyces sp.]|nr:AMP-binding protein [Streptomyces sp.]
PNSLDWIVAALGAVSAGAVLVPLNTRFKGAEAADVLRRSGARLLFVTGTFLGTSYVASLRRAVGEGLPALGGSLEQVVVLSDDAPAEYRTWKDFLASGEGVGSAEVRERSARVDGSCASDIVFTSGTTGRPKGAVITHAQTLRAYEIWSDLAGLRQGDRYLIVNPFFHTFGYKAGVIASLMRGATMIPQPVFNVDTVLANVASEGVSVLPGPPTLLQSLLDHPARTSYDLSALRLVVTGAAVVPLTLVERLRDELGVATVLTAYGLSEASGIVTMCRRGDPPSVIASTSGRAIPGTEVRVEAPLGAPGEVLVRGFNVMRGYFEDEAATAETLTPDGWLRTGDVGVLDPAGNLRITDRLKDMFIVGGFNAYPAEIEQLLGLHPDVTDVAVIGVPDARLGEVGKAYVVRREGAVLTGDDLIAWARREMANYKVPRTVEFVGELPRNASGKVVKGELRRTPAG